MSAGRLGDSIELFEVCVVRKSRGDMAPRLSVGKVLLPIELYSAAEGLEIPPKGSVIFRSGLLQERRIIGC